MEEVVVGKLVLPFISKDEVVGGDDGYEKGGEGDSVTSVISIIYTTANCCDCKAL